MNDTLNTLPERLIIDRLGELRRILPAMAAETAAARREAARLRVENGRLTQRVAELEAAAGQSTGAAA